MKKSVYIFALLAIPLSLNAYTFTRTLNVSSTGEDVRELQKYLNSNFQTRIAETGVGSPGNETTYFGERTKLSVIKLQNLFAPLILYPVGLNAGTGFVGNGTLSFLNNVLGHKTSVPDAASDKVPTVESVTPLELKDGDTITIVGKNFSDKNTVIMGFEHKDKYANVTSTDNGTKITIKYDSSIQKPYDKKFEEIGSKGKEAVLKQFPKIPVAVSVIDENDKQSNFKVLNFNLK